MAQPTTLIATPEPEEPTTTTTHPAETDTAECTAGYAWCNGECDEDDPYHCGVTAFLPLLRFTGNGWTVDSDASLMLRQNESEGDDTQPVIMLSYEVRSSSSAMTAEQARVVAAHLLNAADILDPLPAGAMATTAVQVRIGDDLLTEDGWQKVNGLLFFADTEQASIFTPERTDEDSDGWDLSFNDPVKVRRSVTGSCAIQFVEPIR